MLISSDDPQVLDVLDAAGGAGPCRRGAVRPGACCPRDALDAVSIPTDEPAVRQMILEARQAEPDKRMPALLAVVEAGSADEAAQIAQARGRAEGGGR